MDDAKPFCVNTPWSIPFAYHDKLQTDLDILERQQIIAPVTTPTEWRTHIIVTPKRVQTGFECVLTFHTSTPMCIEKGTNYLPQHKQ